MLFDTLALISIIIVIMLLKRLVNIFPSLMACMIRWKESLNLEASVKHSLDRNMLAAAMVIPFCLTVERFRLYDPSVMAGLNENLHLLLTAGIFLLYFMIRTFMSKIMQPRKMNPKIYKAAGSASFTFFIILTLILIGVGAVMSFMNLEPGITKNAMLWISGAIYMLFLLRKFQIFLSGSSFFAAFLYLCALEFFPTGILTVSAIIF